jgi:hypothetical protein
MITATSGSLPGGTGRAGGTVRSQWLIAVTSDMIAIMRLARPKGKESQGARQFRCPRAHGRYHAVAKTRRIAATFSFQFLTIYLSRFRHTVTETG